MTSLPVILDFVMMK